MPLKVSARYGHSSQIANDLDRYFRVAKQVAQQIAQRAAFLVDQAIQEKVRDSTPRLCSFDLTLPMFSAIYHCSSSGRGSIRRTDR